MTTTIDATFVNGVFKPKEPMFLPDGAEVRLTISPVDEDFDPFDAVIGICETGLGDGAENHDKYIYGKLSPDSRR